MISRKILTSFIATAAFLPTWSMADDAFDSISKEDLARHIEVLSSDAFEGRAPATAGEEKTVTYLANAFANAGAKPWKPGNYEQSIPLVEISRRSDSQFTIRHGNKNHEFNLFDEFVSFAGTAQGEASIADAPLIFAGYGIDAPEFAWNDYSGLDVEGAVVVLLRGEPSRDGDESFFWGRELTEHYHHHKKYQTAAEKGAIGAILIHTEESAGWPWSLLSGGGAGSSQFFINERNDTAAMDVSVQISEPAAEKLFSIMGRDYGVSVEAASTKPGQSFVFDGRVDIVFDGKRRKLSSSNVIAKINGSERPEECVIYTAHWDHVGVNPALEGDQIFNGALDNATGTAALIELAEAFNRLPTPPHRSVYFIATAVEEKGLLGAQYLVDHPVCAPEKTVAVLNMDSHFPFGSFEAMTIVGFGYSELQHEFEQAVKMVNRVVQPDSNPEVGGFFRNDSYPFAKAGIPAIYAVGGPRNEDIENNPELLERFIDYGTNKYHKPADEYDAQTWDLTGVEEDVKVLFEVGRSLAGSSKFPNWRYDLPFRELRDEMLR